MTSEIVKLKKEPFSDSTDKINLELSTQSFQVSAPISFDTYLCEIFSDFHHVQTKTC